MAEIKKKNAVIIKIIALKGKKDVIGSKLLKAFEKIKKQLEMNGFELKESGWHWENEAYYWLVFKNRKIPKTYVREGPPLKAEDNVENFKSKHRKTFVKGNRIYANAERKFTDAKGCIKYILKLDDVKSSFKNAKILS